MIDASSRLRLIINAAAFVRILTHFVFRMEEKPSDGSGNTHDQIALTELLKLQKSGQFPDEPVKIEA